jgi:CDP-diacylglycerol---glycerol-3-phosphate 3-phosphatidyltransferase
MVTISNSVSFFRAPLALLFLQDSVALRLCAIILAMITDSIDGYLARRSRSVSRFGAVLDPAMDKFFVYFALAVFYFEGWIQPFALFAMVSRDIALILYGLCMVACGRWHAIEFRSIRWGKISTTLQFCVLIGLTLHLHLPWELYASFIAMGLFALFELFQLNSPFSARPIH